MKKIIMFSLMAIFLMSCGHYPDGQSVWNADGEPMWIIPLLTGLGSLWFFYVAWRKSKSSSEQQQPDGTYKQFKESVPIYKIGQFYFSCALAIATIVIIIMVNSDK